MLDAGSRSGVCADSRTYGGRRGRALGPRPVRLLGDLLPRFSVPWPATVIDPRALFPPGVGRVALEVGFGGGEHLIHQALALPDTGFVGCEPFVKGVASFLRQVDDLAPATLHNVRIHAGDARPLLDVLVPNSIDQAFILFPDPWPKTRHSGRRFVAPGNLDRLARVMTSGAELRLASDVPALVLQMQRVVCAHSGFDLVQSVRIDPLAVREPGWPPTRYERKASAEGRAATYLIARRF